MSVQRPMSRTTGAMSPRRVSKAVKVATAAVAKGTKPTKATRPSNDPRATKAPRSSKVAKATTSTRKAGVKKVVEYPIGADIDLDVEKMYLPDGSRPTEARAEQIAEDALARHRQLRGRPSISGGGQHTPALTVRVPPATRKELEDIAAAQGRPLADVSRDALVEYAQRHRAAS